MTNEYILRERSTRRVIIPSGCSKLNGRMHVVVPVIVQNYLTSRGMSWRHMLQEALQAVQQGLYHLSDYRITANSFLCYCCGLRTFRELAYKYRERIPPTELPDAVTTRPDCYWGRNCRTQVKAHHALKFNHVCEQTRFKN